MIIQHRGYGDLRLSAVSEVAELVVVSSKRLCIEVSELAKMGRNLGDRFGGVMS